MLAVRAFRAQSLPFLAATANRGRWWSSGAGGGDNNGEGGKNIPVKGLLGGAALLGLGIYLADKVTLEAEEELGVHKVGLPEFSLEQVAANSGTEKGGKVWVTYQHGVYDVTEFVKMHPGATKLLMAAGGSVEPFWATYAVHQNNPLVAWRLEQYRIGNLRASDVANQLQDKDAKDPFSQEPKRHPDLVPALERPFVAETPLSLLTDSFITPADLFYVRNHLPVPQIKIDEWHLEVTGLGVKQDLRLSFDQLKNDFPKHEVVAALHGGGNRRGEMMDAKFLVGLNLRGGAIGNAVWGGVLLSDVLAAAGFNPDECQKASHVLFEGQDTEPDSSHYGASISIEKATNPRGDVLLAYEMNGEDLSPDHGFPVRAIVPGVVAARSVKWLTRVEVSEGEGENHHQRNDYRGVNPSVNWDTVDWSKAHTIEDMPVTSKICSCRRSPESPDQVMPLSSHYLALCRC